MIPSAFRLMLADLPAAKRFPSVRAVVLGSEPAYNTDVDLWRRHFPGAERLVRCAPSVEDPHRDGPFVPQAPAHDGACLIAELYELPHPDLE